MYGVRSSAGIALAALTCAAVGGFLGSTAWAHCDTVAGPVIGEATVALETGDVTPILKWVKQEYEGEITTAFKNAVTVRKGGPQARDLADRYFLETLVRLHRAGEGEPYTGIKDEPLDAIVAMADKALAEGSARTMIEQIHAHAAAAITEKFQRALEARKAKDKSVAAGREFVEAYVIYMHFVENLHGAIVSAGAHGHAEGADHSVPRSEEGHAHGR